MVRHKRTDATLKTRIITSDTVYDFGNVPIKTSLEHTFTFNNTGSDDLIIFDIQNRHPAFAVDSKTDFIPENGSLDITTTFCPEKIGFQTDTLAIYSNNPDGSLLEVILTGNGVNPTQDEVPVSVFPNPFTPNNDGFNDYTKFIFSEIEIQKPVIQIFNLRGEKIFKLDSETGNGYQWNGKDSNGCDAEPGVYIYIFTPKDNQASNGTITLIR